ncbi:Hypothetical predicted protein [Lecanosticta acicola]|uniref:RSE1/DDB1/CPSF1 first beta-propeller domain-containing protein n=1 Tax=Lecanosticta acicola TaxID=111012 RepID=A0AAI8YS78_9PEZI|nr:Hypothetical predicted protein [Lecanosticta acicola]
MEAASQERQIHSIGVLTRTILHSPVIHWILHAQLRHRLCNEVVFVGEDFVHIKEIIPDGPGRRLQHVASKIDFDSRIRAAAIFNNEEDPAQVDFLVKLERQRGELDDSGGPPQLLILTLESNDIVFLYLRKGADGTARFIQQTCPMPCFDRMLFQPGQFLAVDPLSRALAVAANEREVIIYSAKPRDQILREIREGSETWCPVSSQRPLQIEGVIQQMDFLIPPSDDKDHIVLLLIVTDQRYTKAIRIDWHYSSGPHNAQLHPGQPLARAKTTSSLLIPLRDASFLLVTGNEVVRWKDILSGSASGTTLRSPEQPAKFPGNSSHAPTWAGWAKPRRSQAATRGRDSLYLVREDGLVFFMAIDSRGNIQTSFAGDLQCHVGSAFASLGDEGDPDVLAVAGEMSTGRVVSIGAWPSTREMEVLSRDDTMSFDPVEMVPNWASVTDMIGTKLYSNRTRLSDTDNVLITSGRQPYGGVTELRRGVEARMSAFVEIPGLRAATDVWTLPDLALGSIIIVLSYPSATVLYTTSAEFDEDWNVFEDMTAFNTDCRTIAAGITINQRLVQVTDRSICASSSMHVNFEDTASRVFEDDTRILAAFIIAEASTLVTAERHDTGYAVVLYDLSLPDETSGIERRSAVEIEREPLCLSAAAVDDGAVVVAATDNGGVALMQFDHAGKAPSSRIINLSSFTQGHPVCDQLVILQGTKKAIGTPDLLVVCGLRDGKIITFTLSAGHAQPSGDARVIEFGSSTVKLTPLSNEPNCACAMSDNATCLLSWDGKSPQSLRIENIWLTDKDRPHLAQGAITAIAKLPSAAHLSFDTFAESLVLLSGEEFVIATLNQTATTVPRQIQVSGTPNRLVYAEALRHIVCASVRTEVQGSQETRRIWPVIDFVPSRTEGSLVSYHMQPGERVNAIIEWSYRNPTNPDKLYSFVIVGGSYVRHNGTRRGRITFLQPTFRKGSWEIAEMSETRKDPFDQDVYALALYDSITYVACAGESVHLHRLREGEDGRKWDQLCLPFKLASPGAHVTVETDHSGRRLISISTIRDSLVTLMLDEIQAANGAAAKHVLKPVMTGPRADDALRHYIFDTTSALYSRGDIDLFSLMSTKAGQLIGMTCRKHSLDGEPRHAVGDIVFDAKLPRSLTRLEQIPAPARRGKVPSGVLPERVVGAATDGSLVGIALLDGRLWRRLSWLQRLVEWSPDLSPHSYQSPNYNPAGIDRFGQKGRVLPIGFNGHDGDWIMLHTTNSKANDMHIDGDVLTRVLEKNGVEAVKRVMSKLVELDNATGAWMREHVDEELEALDELLGLVQHLDAWM